MIQFLISQAMKNAMSSFTAGCVAAITVLTTDMKFPKNRRKRNDKNK